MPDNSGAVILGQPKKGASIADKLNNSLPAFGLAGCGVNLRFVILPDLNKENVFFVGIIVGNQAFPICFADTFENAVEALDAISTGFLALGYHAGSATFIPEDNDATKQ